MTSVDGSEYSVNHLKNDVNSILLFLVGEYNDVSNCPRGCTPSLHSILLVRHCLSEMTIQNQETFSKDFWK